MTYLLAILIFGGGFTLGHETSTVTAECRSEPLVTTNCVDIAPPTDDSFGATTTSYVSLIGQYRKCKAACETVVTK
ncbi:MAG: hypothetical protein PHP57_13375 [Sideroxydans sp.]|nr:hypothetical protein [Sideroxydans sp.]